MVDDSQMPLAVAPWIAPPTWFATCWQVFAAVVQATLGTLPVLLPKSCVYSCVDSVIGMSKMSVLIRPQALAAARAQALKTPKRIRRRARAGVVLTELVWFR